MIARAGVVNASILGFALVLSACSTPQGPPAGPDRPVPNLIPPTAVPDEANAAMPPPPGADESYLRAEYGQPDFVRDEDDSQLWRYDGSDCALFVFLYRESDPPDSIDSYVLRHAQTNPPGVDGTIDTTCLRSIKQALRPSY